MPVLPRNAAAVIKFAAGILLLPAVYSFSVSFINEFNTVRGDFALYFWAGTASFAIFYIFIYQPELIYNYGQKTLGALFSFYKPLAEAASYALPAYTIALFIIYGVLNLKPGAGGTTGYFLLLIGFSSGLHLVCTAKSLYSGKGSFLKANYIFGFSLVYIANLLLLGFALSLMLKEFSFVSFSNSAFSAAKNIFYAVFK